MATNKIFNNSPQEPDNNLNNPSSFFLDKVILEAHSPQGLSLELWKERLCFKKEMSLLGGMT